MQYLDTYQFVSRYCDITTPVHKLIRIEVTTKVFLRKEEVKGVLKT